METGTQIGVRFPQRSGAELVIACTLLGTRVYFGRDEIKVSPVNGSGESWIAADRIAELPKGGLEV
jgi:hypothetical protein